MSDICECYKKRTEMVYPKAMIGIDPPYPVEYGICTGTPECDRCSCGGDKSICDFYEKNRMEYKKMTTAEMIADSLKNKDAAYLSPSKFSGGIWYSYDKGFHYNDGELLRHVDYLDEIMSLEDWNKYEIPVMTRSEAEKKFNIKIMN